MGESRIEKAIDYITTLFQGNGDGHDLSHSLRVYKNAMSIAKAEEQGEEEIIALSALLHDCDDHKLFHTENNANARCFLQQEGLSEERIEEICKNINSVSFSKNRGKVPETIEGKLCRMQTDWKLLALSVLLAAFSLAEATEGAWRIPLSIFMTSFY